ncbi:MAG: hypothetical protein ABSC23_11750 [Bryobacteraceae bacterium]
MDLGEAFLHDALTGNALQKLFRRQSSAERGYYRALAELRRAQTARRSEEELETEANAPGAARAADPSRSADSLESTQIGFVPPNPDPPIAQPAARPAPRDDRALRL